MPAFVRNKKDEEKWRRAKELAARGKPGEPPWALVTHIFQQLAGRTEARKSELYPTSQQPPPPPQQTGEGSRGGRIVGHTRSGNPIYAHRTYHRTLTAPQTKALLKKGHYSIISAGQNPNHQDEKNLPTDHEVFQQRHEALKQDLERHGFAYTEVEGKYTNKERTFIVHHGGKKPAKNKAFLVQHQDTSEHETIRDLGKKYNQDSVIHSLGGKHEVHYTTGEHAGKHNKGSGHEILPTEQADYYTDVEHPDTSHTKFSLNVDWNKYHDFGTALHKAMLTASPLPSYGIAGRSALNLSNRNAPGFTQGMGIPQIDPELTAPAKPLTADRIGHSGSYRTLASVTGGLGMDDDAERDMRKCLRDLGKGREAVAKMPRVLIPFARKADMLALAEVGIRFKAYALNNGLVKSQLKP